jgi:Tfp pilus assembly protein PilF
MMGREPFPIPPWCNPHDETAGRADIQRFRRRAQDAPGPHAVTRVPSFRESIRHAAVCIVLACLTAVVFQSAPGAGFFISDDDLYVTENPAVLSGLSAEGVAWAFSNVEASNWHPLTWLSHMADTTLFGKGPGARHVVNVVIHGAAALFLYAALFSMTGAVAPSAFVAAVFAVHPLHVESVAWISERKDVLSGAFWMLAMWLYASYARRPSLARYAAVAAAFALGLMSKAMVVTLPCALLLLDYWPLRRWSPGEKGLPRLLAEKLPLLALSLAGVLVGLLAQKGGGAMGFGEEISFPARLGNAAISWVEYLARAVWPARLSFFYPHPGSAVPVGRAVGAALALLAVSAGALLVHRSRPWLGVGWFWFLGTLLPVIGLVQIGLQRMADRYTYIPLIGLAVALAWEVRERSRGTRLAVPAAVAGLAVVLGLGAAARVQAETWKESRTVLEHAVRVSGDNWFAEHCLGIVEAAAGRRESAERHYREALRTTPNCLTLNNLGAVLYAMGRMDEADDCFAEAVGINPGYPDALANLGLTRWKRGYPDDAVRFFRMALSIRPDFRQAREGLEAALAAEAAARTPRGSR